jgi:hypothetical protein
MYNLAEKLKKMQSKYLNNADKYDFDGNKYKQFVFKETAEYVEPDNLRDYFKLFDEKVKPRRGLFSYDETDELATTLSPVIIPEDFVSATNSILRYSLNKLYKDYPKLKPIFKFFRSRHAFYVYSGDVNHYEDASFPVVDLCYHFDEYAIIVEWILQTRISQSISYTDLINRMIDVRKRIREYYERIRLTGRVIRRPRINPYRKIEFKPIERAITFNEFF